jgi:RNA polymerase sigma factor (sigma-70 family)
VALAPALVARLYAGSAAARWNLSAADFGEALERSAAHAFPGGATSSSELESYLTSLRLDDLALATACASGSEAAWDHFVGEYRAAIVRAAEAIDRSGGGRDLADALYADLFGLGGRDGVRRSLFRYFHGRSSLGTWLRAVLAQRHVDRRRELSRVTSLPEDESRGPVVAAPAERTRPADPGEAARLAALREALSSAILALDARDRLRLSLYHVQNVKLAAIGRALGEHEATVSRHLTRCRAEVQRRVRQLLSEKHHMSDAAIDETIRALVDDPGALDAADLIGVVAGGKISDGRRSSE